MEYETVGAAVDGSAVGQPKYKVKSKRKPLEVVMNTIFFLCGMVAVAFVLIISVYLVISGMPAILEIGPINFLFGTRWYASTNDFGILAIILTSFAGTAGAILVGVPIGLMTAIFLAKVAPSQTGQGGPHRRGTAGRHPLCRVRPGGHDPACSRHPGGLQPALRTLPSWPLSSCCPL